MRPARNFMVAPLGCGQGKTYKDEVWSKASGKGYSCADSPVKMSEMVKLYTPEGVCVKGSYVDKGFPYMDDRKMDAISPSHSAICLPCNNHQSGLRRPVIKSDSMDWMDKEYLNMFIMKVVKKEVAMALAKKEMEQKKANMMKTMPSKASHPAI